MEPHVFLWLRPAVTVHRDGTNTALVDAAGDVVLFEDDASAAADFIALLDGSRRVCELAAMPAYAAVVPALAERGWLVTLHNPLAQLLAARPNASREIAAYAQLFPNALDWHFMRLARKRVLIVGAGGIGTHLAFALAACGIGGLTIVDPDTIEPTNLNRQFLFTANDVGAAKVAVVARAIGARFAGIAVTPIQRDFDAPELAARLLSEADLVILCGEAGILHDDPALVARTPLMVTGYRGQIGTVGPLIVPATGGSACWACLMADHNRAAMRVLEECAVPRENGWNPSGFAINALTGALCSRVCVEFLSEQPSAARWIGMQLSASMASLEIAQRPAGPSSCAHTLPAMAVAHG